MFAIATFLILVYFGIWTGGLWNVRYHVRNIYQRLYVRCLI